jgi:hypothetical protein
MTPRPWQTSHGSENARAALPDALARHLDQAERRHLGDLVLRAVAAEALEQPAQHELAVDSSTMSMKSTTMIPPMSRSRSCRTISSAASRLFW